MYNNKFDKPYRNINIIDNTKVADLFNLINNMNIYDIKQYVMIDYISLAVVDKDGNNLIHAVLLNTESDTKTEQQRLNMIEYLYNENVNPNAMNSKNLTPLHIACTKQYYTIVKFLLEKGVDANYKDNNGNTPFHSLLSGKIKIEEKKEHGIIIPKSKKLDMPRVEYFKELRNNIWKEIKDSPYLLAISNTIENTISSSNECKENIIEFQEELLKQNLSLDKTNNMNELKELKDISINDFISTIEKQWGKFQQDSDIVIHSTLDTSWGPTNNGLSILKNADLNINIMNQLDTNIIKIGTILKSDEPLVLDNIDDINTIIYDNKPADDNKLDEYYNVMKHPHAIDMADNIIDWDNYTFIGGSRAVGIINEVSVDFIKKLMKQDEKIIVKTMAYSIFINNYEDILDYNINNIDEYNFINLGIKNIVVKYIVEVIYDNVNLQTETDLIQKLNIKHYNIVELINNRRTSNKISWLYHFIISYLCNNNINIDPYTNLSCNINQLAIYLISCMANNKGNNLKLSISQVFKSRLISPEIFDLNGFSDRTKVDIANINIGSLYSSWIYLLLNDNTNIEDILLKLNTTEDINNYINTIDDITIELKQIIIYTYNLFNNGELIIPTSYKDKGLNEGEILCHSILVYYKNMQQKPLLQNLVDTISLIRFKNTLYKYKKDEVIAGDKLYLLKIRILHLYEKPLDLQFEFKYNETILDVTNSFHASIDNILPRYLNENILNSDTNDISSYQFFKNIGFTKQINTKQKDIKTNEIAIESFLISEYCMPSKLYFYLSNGFNYIDNMTNTLNKLNPAEHPIYEENLAIYLLKKIEASHLGLCFMGRLSNFNYNIVRKDDDIYFYSHNMNNIKPHITNIRKFFTISKQHSMSYCCPPTIYQYNNLLDKTYNRVIEIQNKINKIIAKTLENMKQTKISKTYSSVIVNLYPVLLGIISIVDTISGMRQNITNDKLENDLITNILYKDINTDESILKIFKKIDYPIINIEHFNNIINLINSYMYLFYYIFSNKVKIPQFIYNTIGKKPLIIYDSNDSILYPPQQFKSIPINTIDSNIDNNINSNINIPNIVNNSYMMVINNFNHGIFFMNKEIIKNNFVADKNTALPPSLHNILGEFYKINSKQLIKTSVNLHKIFDNIKDNMIKETKLQPDVLKLQKYYMGAKITEELIQIFAKSKIKQVALFLYKSIIQNNSNKIDNSIMVEKLSYDINLDITIDVNSDVNSYNKILKLTDDSLINNILQANYHMIVENNNIVSTKIKTFVIYPSYYNNTSLLKSTYVVDINTEIIDILLYNRGNIFIYNMENISPLCLLIKQNNYIILKYITDLVNRNKIDNIYREPYNYLISQYKMNLHLFMPTNDIKNNIKQFVSSQYNDVKQIIQASDIYFNNILVNLELSFSICNYLTQQYLLERIIEYKYKFKSEFNTYLDKTVNLQYNAQLINCNDLYYNMILSVLKISDNDNNILIVKIIKDIDNKMTLLNNLLLSYKLEKLELDKDKVLFSTKIEILNNKIKNTEAELDINFTNTQKLYKLYAKITNIDASYDMGKNKTRLIRRYDILRMKMNYANNNYIDGWNKIINNLSIDLFISTRIIEERNNVNGSIEYYEEMNKICIEYFESQRYYNNNNINTNNIIKFVYDTLIHLTRTIICSSIENIIRKILFETFNNGYYNEMDRNKKFKNIVSKIDYIITDEIRNYLYNDVAKKFVKTSVSIFKDSNEKASYEIATVTEILNSFVDLMLVESFTKLDNNIIEILKNNIIPYYDTIVNKIIINWNITIENMFLYMINQYRYVKMIEVLQ